MKAQIEELLNKYIKKEKLTKELGSFEIIENDKDEHFTIKFNNKEYDYNTCEDGNDIFVMSAILNPLGVELKLVNEINSFGDYVLYKSEKSNDFELWEFDEAEQSPKAQKLERVCVLLNELKDLLTNIDDEDFNREYKELDELHDRACGLHIEEIEGDE